MPQIPNASWARSTADQLWDGEDDALMTAHEYSDMTYWNEMCRDMANTERMYGDCGRSIVGTGDYEQLLEEDARVAWGLPAVPGF
jgi:chitinase